MGNLWFHLRRNKVLALALAMAVLVAVETGEDLIGILIVIVGLLQRQVAVPAEEVIDLDQLEEIGPIDAV
jgi:hypothetical protein